MTIPSFLVVMTKKKVRYSTEYPLRSYLVVRTVRTCIASFDLPVYTGTGTGVLDYLPVMFVYSLQVPVLSKRRR
jgi:hypothetical protein